MDTKQLYQERLARYLTALRNEKPDKIPIRPFVAEFTARPPGDCGPVSMFVGTVVRLPSAPLITASSRWPSDYLVPRRTVDSLPVRKPS